MINLVKLNKIQLASFIESDEYKSLGVLPISKHRAISHINNPNAAADDVLLILAYEEGQLLGYLGILPDAINIKIHAGWLSCLWVSPKARGKGIAKQLVLAAYQAYNKHILITNFTSEAGSLYNRLGIFDDLFTLRGLRIYRKMCLGKIIPQRYPKYSAFSHFFKIMDAVFNFFWSFFLTGKKELKKMEINILNDLTTEHVSFIRQCSRSNFNRNKPELDWIRNFPWLIQKKTFSPEAKKYHFSSEEKLFRTILYEVRSEKSLIAVILLSNRNGHLRFPYVFYKSENEKPLATVISYLIRKENPTYITLFESEGLLKQIRTQFIYKKYLYRNYLKTKEIEIIGSFDLYDGDGDAAFT